MPLLVAISFLPAPQNGSHVATSLDQISRTGTTGGVIASHVLHQFRRLLLEHGGMQHSESSVSLGIAEWLTRLYDNCIQAIPDRYVHERCPQISRRHIDSTAKEHPCLLQVSNNDAVTLQSVTCSLTSCVLLRTSFPHSKLLPPFLWVTRGFA